MNDLQTISRDYVLRKTKGKDCILYDKSKDKKYIITPKLFTFLYLLKKKPNNLAILFRILESNSIEINDIKRFLSQNEFSNLLTNKIDFLSTEGFDLYNIAKELSPFTEYSPERIDLLITKRCNLNCKHCFENSSPNIKSSIIELSDVSRLFKEIDDLNVQTLKITGGEPFCYPHFEDILKLTDRTRFECIILTNAMLIKESSMDIISGNGIKLGISIDGINSESHDYIRGSGSFEILQKKLLLLKKHKVKYSMTLSLHKKNFKEISDISEFVLSDLGARRLFINQLKPLGRAYMNKDIFITDEDYNWVKDEVNRLSEFYNDKVIISDDSLLHNNDNENNKKNFSLVCSAGNRSLSIDNLLDVYPCVYGNGIDIFKMGNLRENSLLEIWNSDKWKDFRGVTTLIDIEGCSSCEYNKFCDVKNCRLKPVYEGKSFYSHVSYCKKGN